MVLEVAAAAAAHNLRGMEAEDRAAGAVVLVDAVESCSRRYSNHLLPSFPREGVEC